VHRSRPLALAARNAISRLRRNLPGVIVSK